MSQIDYFKLGRWVAYYRSVRRYTQEQLAELCDLSPSYIGCIERGDRKMSLEVLVSLSRTLKVTPNMLLQDSLPEIVSDELLDTPLILRQPDYTLRNTLSNWYFDDLPDESMLSDPPISFTQLENLGFTLLGEDFSGIN